MLNFQVELTKGSLPWRNMTEIQDVGNEKRAIRRDPIVKKKMFGG